MREAAFERRQVKAAAPVKLVKLFNSAPVKQISPSAKLADRKAYRARARDVPELEPTPPGRPKIRRPGPF
jgi:hypothetical protein